ncbi:37S ribosomal protein S18 [Yarrowia sp. C11]|nr:37S ribosomal protein S18 [Yarrowia sp. E02]KAG5371894.1 37S ribosomal protein S18 [Yarrowia sp. C11]
MQGLQMLRTRVATGVLGSVRHNSGLASFMNLQKEIKKIPKTDAEELNKARETQRKMDQSAKGKEVMRHYIYVTATKNNMHICASDEFVDRSYIPESIDEKLLQKVRAPQEVRFHISCGHLGIKKKDRGEFDGAFQTSVRAFELLEKKGMLSRPIEIVLRGFGSGREGFFSALTAPEGEKVASKVDRLSDRTKLNQGGTRPPGRRRV